MATAIDVLKQLDERIQASVSRVQQLRKENEQLQQKLAFQLKMFQDSRQLQNLPQQR